MTRDTRGDLWVGTEDFGAWRFDNTAKKWIQNQTKDGLGDNNVYAITTDGLNRVWVGHLNSGVSVWNGRSWKNYRLLQGPLGERIFAMATCPSDGDVWMATNAGLTRYSVKKDEWTHLSKADGLPTHEISALSFDSLGNLYVGTQCDGLLILRSSSDYAQIDHIKGAEKLPDVPVGEGLPSNRINDVLVADDDTLFVATDTGLARSHDFGNTWKFLRGLDWENKLKGLYDKRRPQTEKLLQNVALMREDYITSIAEDPMGLLWVAYRRKGYEIRRPLVDHPTFTSEKESNNEDFKFPYVSHIAPIGDGKALLGTYSEGLRWSVQSPNFTPTKDELAAYEQRRGWRLAWAQNTAQNVAAAPFPTPAKTPDLAQLHALILRLKSVPAFDSSKPMVAALDEDWLTQGDWLGRYGRYNAVLCAMVSPGNLHWGAGEHPLRYHLQISPREKAPEQRQNSIRYWVHWLKSDYKRVLEMPPLYFQSRVKRGLAKETEFRRQAEVDDNGEEYPLWKEGPDVYASLEIPKGVFVLSFYNHNKDGHHWLNRMRDYSYSLKAHPNDKPLRDVSHFDSAPELARGRQRDFWGGVYKRYVVRGPQKLTLKIGKENSLNTILAGIFLDLIEEEAPPYLGTFGEWEAKYDGEDATRQAMAGKPFTLESETLPTTEAEAAERLWNELERVKVANPAWWMSERRRFYEPLVRWLEASKTKTTSSQWPQLLQRLSACYYNLSLYEQWEAQQKRRGVLTAREVEKSLVWDGKSITSGNSRQLIVAHLETLAKSQVGQKR